MRGRLIQRFVCVLRRLDATATAAVVGGGYDDVWRTTRPVEDGTQTGSPSRREGAAIRLPCQLDRRTWGGINERRSGKEIEAQIIITLHWPDLVAAGLIAADGTPQIQQGDRIEAIETRLGAVEETFADPPGMYVHDLERAGHGLAAFGTPKTNLLFLYCNFGKVSR
jgi:hypothetical protein